MKKAKNSILACFLCACMLFGLVSPLGTATASAAETEKGKTPVLSETKYLLSTGQTHMLIATGIKDYDDVYEVGYAIKDMDNVVKTHAVTTKYYTSIAKGSARWTVEQLFGADYTGMIVWEVAYDTAKDYSYEAYAKVGNRVDGNLVKSDTVVYGTRRDVVNNYAVTFVVGNDFVEERAITVGEPYGKLPKAPASDVGTFKGWYLNADGTGEAITADTLVTTKGNHTLYAIYDNKISYDFSDQSQLDNFGNAQNVTYEIESYLKVTGTPGSESILVLKKELTAGQTVEIDVEYVGQNVSYNNGQITFLAYTANVAGDADNVTTVVKGNAPWDGGWDCKQTTVPVEVTQDCAGIRMQFVMNSDAGAYFKITDIRINENDNCLVEYDFSEKSQLDDFANAKNVTYEVVNDYLKAVGIPGSENILVLKQDLIAGQTVEIDVEYVGQNVSYNNGQITFLAYTANVAGDADNVTTVVKGNAPWDGGWDCRQTTVPVEVTQDCAGIRMQFVMNNDAGAYFKITGIRIIVPIVTSSTYDFSDASQLDNFVELDHGGKEIVADAAGTYAKFTPTDENNLYSIFWLKQDLRAGMTVEMDFELVGSIAVNHGIWTWGADASGGAQFDGQFVTGWDAPTVWNGGKFTSTTNITADCYGIRIQMKYGDNAEAYWKLTEVRIIAPVEYPIAYDLSDDSVLDDFVELDHGGKEVITDATGTYVKFTPTDMNNLYSIFWLKQSLKAGMTVEMDFELVGSIAVNHGIWTWGANASGGAQFDGQFVTGWDAPSVWNGGKFTSTTNITADCYGVRIQMKYGDNVEAYWKLTSIRILDGSTLPAYKVTTNINGNKTTSDITFGQKYGPILPDTTPAQAHMEFKGWYLNPTGTGVSITADTAMTMKDDHTIYAVYEETEEYPRVSDFFETEQPTNIRDVDNTTITQVRDASGNYIKLSPTSVGDTTHVNNPQSQFVFDYPYLQENWVVEMDFELVGDRNVNHGIWTYGANANGDSIFDGQYVTGWDAPSVWNNGKFTAATRITQACQGVRVLVRYANNPNAYWKLTGIRVYTSNEYLDIPIYADDKQIDIGATSWLGTNQTINYFNGDTGEANFKKLQEAGITTLAGTFYGDTGSEEDETRLLDMAAKYGIGLYFQKTWDGETIPSYVSHKAFLGYYIDEPSLAELGNVGTLQQKWDASDFGANGKLLYVNLLPIYSDEAGDSYETYLSTAIGKGLQMVSYDHYAMYYKAKTIFGNVYGYSSTLSCRTDWLQNFDVASSYAKGKNIPLWYTLLATQHLADGDLTKYKDPNVNDLTYQMYVAMTYGATHLTHYTFAGTGDYIIDGAMFNQNTGEWTQTYYDVKEASAKIREWDHVFMNFDWLGVSAVKGTSGQTGFINNLTHQMAVDANGVMKGVTSTQDVLVGHFKDNDGYAGVMVTNLSTPDKNTATDVTITFSDAYQAVKVYQNGQEKLVYLNEGVLNLSIASAEGVFLIPVKAK